MTEQKPCSRCAFGTECTCDFYREWVVCEPSQRSVPEQLRLRRSESWRSPRLRCGRRDPISRSQW
jgi:hypothetical protein